MNHESRATNHESRHFDVAIIGGGAAGSQAALTLARSCRKVALFDMPRTRPPKGHWHNMIGVEGITREAFLVQTQAELAQYPEVTRIEATVAQAERSDDGFVLRDESGKTYTARKLLLACGIASSQPKIEGMAALWGWAVLHCAYCHGYEARGKKIGLLAASADVSAMLESTQHLSPQVMVFFNGEQPAPELLITLSRLGVGYELAKIERVEEAGGEVRVHLTGKPSASCAVLFVKPLTGRRSEVAYTLGCEQLNDYTLKVDGWGRTSAAGVYAAGDIAGFYYQLGVAASSGLTAGVMINTDLSREALQAKLSR